MSLHKKPKKPETKPEENIFEKMTRQLEENNKTLTELNRRMDVLIASDKEVHKQIDKPADNAAEKPEDKAKDADTSDKKEELEEKVEKQETPKE